MSWFFRQLTGGSGEEEGGEGLARRRSNSGVTGLLVGTSGGRTDLSPELHSPSLKRRSADKALTKISAAATRGGEGKEWGDMSHSTSEITSFSKLTSSEALKA